MATGGFGAPFRVTLRNVGNQNKQRFRAAEVQKRLLRQYQVNSAQLQRLVVDEVKKDLRRPQATTGRLEAVTSSKRNRSVSQEGFAVGSVTYLQASKVKYALAIEFGTTAHVGRRLVGLWFGGGQFSPFDRTRTDQKFRMLRLDTARKLEPGIPPSRMTGVIREEIRSHNDYGQAWVRFNPRERTREMVRRALH